MKGNFVHGEWLANGTAALNVNPSDVSDIVGEYAFADEATTRGAIEAASRAFFQWSRSTPQLRCDVLDFIGSEILARRAELGELLAREEGKTLPEATGEVMRAGQIFKFYAGEALRTPGQKMASVRPGIEIDVTREPIGVVGIITPWNFPIAIPAWKIAPALAYGNSVVFKPAELVPGSAWALAEIISRSGLPPGVFNLVMGAGSVVGQTLLDDNRVKGISFTGSVAIGRRIAASAVARMAKVQLEMGGKNPLVILDDADLTTAVDCAVQSAYYSTGQRCTASSRMLVTEGIHDRFVAAVSERIAQLRVGDARSKETDIGPVVDARQLTQDLSYIAIAQTDGCTLAAGGGEPKQSKKGFYLTPALLTGATNNMRINKEEVFGPVASVIKVRDYEEALALSNDTEFGLCAGICTSSLKSASHFRRNAQVGMVMVNAPTAGVDYHVPFGGTKGSSYGSREQGTYAAEFYTTVKTAYTNVF